jgi:uncharacterized protein YprB with RNaseH-like and TPR domain
MLQQLNLERLIVLDIETVSQYNSYESLDNDWKVLWDKKAQYLKSKEEESSEALYNRAGIYAEFGKIICISVGIFRPYNDFYQLRLKSFYHDDEHKLLSDFTTLLNTKFHNNMFGLAAHNGKEFDFPYLSRRILINNLALPMLLDNAGKKPWEVNHIDTMELWKFGDYKNFTSLNLLAKVFDIPTPKDDIDGSMVGQVYWQQKDLNRIATYCQKDVITVAQLLLRFMGKRLLTDNEIVFSE